jgi:hypothetical protein
VFHLHDKILNIVYISVSIVNFVVTSSSQIQNVNEDASFESVCDAILNVFGVSVAISCN